MVFIKSRLMCTEKVCNVPNFEQKSIDVFKNVIEIFEWEQMLLQCNIYYYISLQILVQNCVTIMQFISC